jgi:hypothetical protein
MQMNEADFLAEVNRRIQGINAKVNTVADAQNEIALLAEVAMAMLTGFDVAAGREAGDEMLKLFTEGIPQGLAKTREEGTDILSTLAPGKES